MKALILAAGKGTRLKQLTEAQNKCMLFLNDKPVLEQSLMNVLQGLGGGGTSVSEIVIVVGYRADDIMSYYGNEYRGIPIKYVYQKEQRGLVHAMECARSALNGEDFILMLGDELFVNPRHREFIDAHRLEENFVSVGVVFVREQNLIKKTYACLQDDISRRIFRLVEKPRVPFNDLMGTGNVIFNGTIFEYLPRTPVNPLRGEKDMTELIQAAVDDGQIVKSFVIADGYVNINTSDDADAAVKELTRQ